MNACSGEGGSSIFSWGVGGGGGGGGSMFAIFVIHRGVGLKNGIAHWIWLMHGIRIGE